MQKEYDSKSYEFNKDKQKNLENEIIYKNQL
jgi:hypothetical protein